MTTPRAHADLATLYFSDSEMKCWIWDEFGGKWQELDDPSFSPEFIYHVGKTAPAAPPQIMCELAGVEFPMPATSPLEDGGEYYVPDLRDPKYPWVLYWRNSRQNHLLLEQGVVQRTREGAVQQGQAMLAASKQAVERPGSR